jgi:hypothetical protein
MEIKEQSYKIIKPESGLYLTQKDDVADNIRFYSTEIHAPSNFNTELREATEEERAAFIKRTSEDKEETPKNTIEDFYKKLQEAKKEAEAMKPIE